MTWIHGELTELTRHAPDDANLSSEHMAGGRCRVYAGSRCDTKPERQMERSIWPRKRRMLAEARVMVSLAPRREYY